MRTKKNFSKAIVIVLALAAIATFTAVFNNGNGTTGTPVAPESTGSVDYVNDPEAVYNHEDVTANGKTWEEVLAEREKRDKNKDGNSSNDKPVQKLCGAKGFTYADGTTSQTYIEFLFDNLIANGDTKRAILDTLVKSGVTNKMAGQTVHSNSYGTIDVTHANEGYVTLKLTKNCSKTIRGAVDYTDADGKTHLYDWDMAKGETYTIPTYFSDGKYTVSILENVNGTKYTVKLSVNITVKSDSLYQTFLNSTRQANFEASPNATAKAKELTANCKTDAEKINVIYNWVYDNIKYDEKFANGKHPSNQADPFDLDEILEDGKGVCRHRAVLVSGMLRSLGIPCRTASSGTHAWIQVWYETGTSKKNGVTYSEGAWIPAAVPGMKLGLTNLAVIFALYRLSPRDAAVISLLRVLLVSMTFGNAYSFAYSLAGAALSLAVMAGLKRAGRFSILGVSIAGGVCHNLGQIFVAMAVLGTTQIAWYLPPLLVSGTLAGIAIGVAGGAVVERIKPKAR